MRIEIDGLVSALAAEDGRLDGAMASCQRQVAGMCAALDMTSLRAEAYMAVFDRVRRLRAPLAQAQYVALEALRAGNEINAARASALPQTSGGVCDTDECACRIQGLLDQNSRLADAQDNIYAQARLALDASFLLGIARSCDSMISQNMGIIDELQHVVDEAQRYAADSAGFYADARSAAAALGQANASASTFLSTGAYGSLSWTGGVAAAYSAAGARQHERVLLKRSEGGHPIVSADGRYIYCNGKKWKVNGPGAGGSGGEGKTPVFNASWTSAGNDLVFTSEEMDWAYFLAHFGTTSGGTGPNADPRISVNQGAAANINGANLLFEVSNNAIASRKDYTVAFRFEERNGEHRVTIFANKEYSTKPTGLVLLENNLFLANMDAKQLYEDATGHPPQHPLLQHDVICDLDEARNEDGNYYSQLYFDEGQLHESLIQYPDDRIEITVGLGGHAERINVTDCMFNGGGREAPSHFVKLIFGSLEQA